ncbi:class I SAM-dependent methyltransferase [Candidatus Riflebacteria bacterium]
MKRRFYFDAEPWYRRENTIDWYQQMSLTNEAVQKILSRLVSVVHSILEVACGGGGLAIFLASLQPAKYLGFDFAETAILNAKERLKSFPNFSVHTGDALELGEYTDNYDLIIAHQFFHCLIGKDRREFLSNCKKALKNNNGILIISSMHGVPVGLEIDTVSRINKPENRYYAYDYEIKSEIESVEFTIIETSYPEKHSVIFVSRYL